MPALLRLLLIGDFEPAPILGELRRCGYDPECGRVSIGDDLGQALQLGWDVAIAGFAGAASRAPELLRTIHEIAPELPFIVAAGEVRDEDVVAALREGAADFLNLRNLARLGAAVQREIRTAALRRERTRLEEQFRHSQKMEAVGRLAGGVAHDFNNLLTVIAGYSDLLLGAGDLTPSQRDGIEHIGRAAARAAELTRRLLAFGRREPVAPRVVRVNEFLLRMESLLRRLIGEDIELAVIPNASRDAVEADVGGLEQVVMNLAVNARDAMPGGGKLTIEAATVEIGEGFAAKQLGVQPGPHVAISVTDTGSGMDEKTLAHAFEPFFTTKSAGKGTGLGLATAYALIRQSGGAIGILSEPGKGCTVKMYLPLAEGDAKDETGAPPAPEAPGGSETILVVEDDDSVRRLLADVLVSRGYRVLEAARGAEAIETCRRHSGAIHLALVDVVLPEMRGPDVVRQMELLRPSLRTIYVSGYSEEATGDPRITESGAGFLQKPFLPEALTNKVREALDAAR